MSSKFIFSTTSMLDNYKIHEYLGTVTAHVVTGTGLFSDIAASFTDVFGGRSNSYQKQLTSIKNEVLSQLRREAISLSANCILGLSIDFDEISGKGKTMFMVTAMGTAVKISKLENNFEEPTVEISDELVSSEKVIRDIHRNSYITLAKEKRLSLVSESNWRTIIELNLTELVPYICDKVESILAVYDNTFDSTEENKNIFKTNFSTFFGQIPRELAITHIYELAKNTKVQKFALKILEELELLDYCKIMELLNSDDLTNKKLAMKILQFNKPFYSYGDVRQIENIAQILESKFPEIGTIFEKKGLMSSKIQKLWKCKCGTENQIESKYCYSCNRNIFGFTDQDLKPEDTKRLLLEKASIILKHLDSLNN